MSSAGEHLRLSPAHEAHQRLGARTTEFAGWLLPLRYESGTTSEHLATRTSVGVFDVSHLGRIAVEGPEAFDLLQAAFTNDLSRIGVGRAQYTLALDHGGGVADDVIVWWEAEESFLVIPNAANTKTVLRTLRSLVAERSLQADAVDVTADTAMFAVQGPAWEAVLRAAGFSSMPKRFGVLAQGEARIAGTGYTGERGVELVVPAREAAEFFMGLARAASQLGGGPAGLGARDTLRLEMGYPLWGNEMDTTTSPYEAGLEWVVVEEKPDFVGKTALPQRKARRRWDLVGVVMQERGAIPRHGYRVVADGTEGVVTSGGFSPVLEKGIALVRIPHGAVKEGEEVHVDIRGRSASGIVTDPPFVKTSLSRS